MLKECKRAIAAAVLVLGLTAGCSKNSSTTTTAYINFVAGNAQDNYEVTASNASIVNSLYLLTLTASATQGTAGNIVINLASAGPFTANEVFSNAYVTGTVTPQAQLEYVPDETQSADYISLPLQDSISRVVVKLTDVTGNSIKGTFTASLVSRTDTSVVAVTLTTGSFYAPFAQPVQ
jgi:hypothetical protein